MNNSIKDQTWTQIVDMIWAKIQNKHKMSYDVQKYIEHNVWVPIEDQTEHIEICVKDCVENQING